MLQKIQSEIRKQQTERQLRKIFFLRNKFNLNLSFIASSSKNE